MRFVVVISALILLAFALGAVMLGGDPEVSGQVAAARDETAATWARAWLWIRVGFAAVGLATAAGCAVALVKWALRRARTIYPDRAGLLPAMQLGAREVYADLNRAPAGVVLTGRGAPPRLPEPTAAGLQVTTQAQAAQALAAATRDGGLNLAAAKLLSKIGRQPQAPAALPEVKISDLEPAHIERLLIEAGDYGDEPSNL